MSELVHWGALLGLRAVRCSVLGPSASRIAIRSRRTISGPLRRPHAASDFERDG